MAAKAGTAYVDFQADLSTLNKQVGAAVAPLTSKFGKLGKAGAVGLGAVVVGGAAAAKALYDIGAEFDDAYDKIRVGTGKTGKQLGKLENDFKNVVSSVPADFDDAATAIAQLNQRLDISGKPLRRMSKQMLELSRITDTDLSENIASVTRLFGDWSVKTGQQGATLDKLFRVSQNTGVAVSELARNMVQFGSPLRQLGINFDHAAAMFAEFEQAGVNTQTLMPGLRFAIKSFSGAIPATTAELKKLHINLKNPQVALQQIMEMIKRAPTDLKANALAFKVFGVRAGPDMAAAIREGHFELGKLIDQMDHGKDTIRGAGKDTMDASESFKLLSNRLKVLVEPAATLVFKTVGKLALLLANFKMKDIQRALGLTGRDMREFGQAISRVADIVKRVFGPVIKEAIKGAVQSIRGFAQVIRGVVRVIGGVLTGDFGRAWKGVKDIFSGGIKLVLGQMRALVAPISVPTKAVARVMVNLFGGAWKKVKSIFRDGANAVLDIVGAIADVINVIPGVPDITVPSLGGGGGGTPPRGGRHGANTRYSGGPITRPMAIVGEEAPAHPEWVIATNPAYRANNLRYWAQAGKDLGVPGFGLGGTLAGAAGDVGGFAKGLPGKALGVAGDVLGKGVQFFLDKLPDPADYLPRWLLGTGAYVIDKVTDYIRSGFKEGDLGGGGGAGGFGGLEGSGRGLMMEISKRKGWHFPDWWALDAAETGHGANLVNPNSTARLRGQFLSMNWGAYGPGSDPTPWPPMDEQIISMARYIQDRYGNPSAAWAFHQAHNWYRTGGLLGGRPGAREGNPFDPVAMRTSPQAPPPLGRAGSGGFLPRTLDRIKAKANLIAKNFTGYVWGGGHSEGTNVTSNGLDCSGAVAKLMQQSGWPDFSVAFSGDYASRLHAGAGDLFTLYANNTHTFVDIAGKQWGTNTTNGLGYAAHTTAGFTARHPILASGAGGEAGAASDGGKDKPKLIAGLGSGYPKILGENFGPLPTTLKAITTELHIRRLQLRQTQMALKNAKDDEAKYLTAQAKRLSNRIKHLLAQRNRIILRHRRAVSRVVARRGSMPEQSAVIGRFEDKIATISEDIRKALALEGDDFSEADRATQTGLYSSLVGQQFGLRNYLIGAEWTGRYLMDTLSGQIARMQKNPRQRWRVPGLKAARANISGTLLPEWEDRLTGLQGPGGPRLWLMDLPALGVLGGEIFDTQLEQRDLGLAQTSDQTASAARDAERIGILEELLREANLRSAVQGRQFGILGQTPPLGPFHGGGVVDAPPNREVLARVTGQEGIFTPEQMAALGGGAAVEVLVRDQRTIVKVNGEEVRAVVRDETRKMARGPRTPGLAGSLNG